MQKQTHKYMLSMLIATLLVLSMFPLVVPVQAGVLTLTTPAINQQVEVGEEVWVNGTADVGELIKVYWETETPANLLGEEYALGGSFSILVTIPPALAGTHYILLRPSGTISSRALVVISKIKLTPDTGLKGDTITVAGSGFGNEKVVTVRLWNTTVWNMKLTTTPTEVKTGTTGSFTCTFVIPTNATTYGTYHIEAKDTDNNIGDVILTVGATITLNPVQGPSGTKVAITARGFTATAGKAVTVTFGNDSRTFTAPEVADITTRSDGTFSGDIIVPTLDVDIYDVIATDEMGISSGAVEFDVRGKTSITLTPVSAPPDAVVTIEGVNFTAIVNTQVTIKFWTGTATVTISKTFNTNSTGGFKGTFTIPVDPRLPIRTEPYIVNATDAKDLYALVRTFRIVRTIAALYPAEGPTGKEVEIWASGLTQNAPYNISIAGKLMVGTPATGTLTSAGELPANTKVYVPTVPAGTHTITVMDDEGVTASQSFKVTATTKLALDPPSAPVGYAVNITMNNFIQINRTTITLTIYNSTWDEALTTIATINPDPGFEAVRTNATGSFAGWFAVPDDLIVGNTYKINATDGDLKVDETPFSIVYPTVQMSTRLSEYVRGETVSFYVKSTFKDAFTITVTDPADVTTQVPIAMDDWVSVEDYYLVRYEKSLLVLPSDAQLGTWTWAAEISDLELGGTFSVVEAPTGVAVIERLQAVEDSLAALRTSVGGVSTDIAAVEAYVDELEADLAAVSTAVSGIEASATAAETAATAARTAAEQANTTASGISMAVYGSMALSLIAALAAIAAVLTLQRKVAG